MYSYFTLRGPSAQIPLFFCQWPREKQSSPSSRGSIWRDSHRWVSSSQSKDISTLHCCVYNFSASLALRAVTWQLGGLMRCLTYRGDPSWPRRSTWMESSPRTLPCLQNRVLCVPLIRERKMDKDPCILPQEKPMPAKWKPNFSVVVLENHLLLIGKEIQQLVQPRNTYFY